MMLVGAVALSGPRGFGMPDMADQAISSGSSDFKWEYANIQLCRDEVLEGVSSRRWLERLLASFFVYTTTGPKSFDDA